jgi:hypothetical protein
MLPAFGALTRLMCIASLVAVVATCAVAPPARAAEEAPPKAIPGTAPLKNAEPEIHGIKLGEFKIRSDYPAEAQKSTVRFVLYAAVKEDRQADMERVVSSHQEKLRDEIITTTRLTPLGMFEESDLKAFRRRLFVRLHRTVPKLVIDDLYISEFGLIVKSL